MLPPLPNQEQERLQGPTAQRSNPWNGRLGNFTSVILLILLLLSMFIDLLDIKSFETFSIIDHNEAKLVCEIQRIDELPETKDHLTTIADVEALKFQFANKSLDVYRESGGTSAIILEEFKLVFFYQAKVASTSFKTLLRRMQGIKDWRAVGDGIVHDPKKNDLTYLYHYNATYALTVLTDPSWTRAIFVRDPKERILSAYLDKAEHHPKGFMINNCCDKNNTCGKVASGSFLGFLHIIEEHCCCNPHWKAQSKRVDKQVRPFINFVGRFESLDCETKRMFKRLDSNLGEKSDMWTRFGASGWGTYGNEPLFNRDPESEHIGNPKNAHSKLIQYYNATTEAFVERLYADDYEDPILNFTRFSLFDGED